MNKVITADHTELYVKDWGRGQPVVLIHGWPLSADSWDSQAMAIAAAGYRVLAYDRRGFGRSTQPYEGYDYDTLSDDLAALITQANLDEVILIGFSMGGGEVARYMSRHAGKGVVKTALVSSILPFRLQTADNPKGTPQSAFDQTAAAILEDRPKFLTGFFEKFFGVSSDAPPVSAELLRWAHSVAMQGSLRATLECAKAFASTDFRAELAAFTVPTLIVHGVLDQTVPIAASARLAARGIVDRNLIEYADAPHGLTVTHRARLNEDLLSFFRE